MSRFEKSILWGIPPVMCLALYWPGLMAWFQLDDFAWLGLAHDLRTPADLPQALFAPMAQGTIRPLSERAFFFSLSEIFGFRAFPFRACVFITQFANLWLLAALARRLSGSTPAALLACLFWTANGALALPMSWTSAYNQVLAAFFLLAAFYCLVRHTESGERRFRYGEWAAFLLGFGALEINAVYPAVAAAWLLASARERRARTAPMFLVSGAYAVAHYWATQGSRADSVYTIQFDPGMARVLATYWGWALGWTRLPAVLPSVAGWVAAAATAALTLGLAAFFIRSILRRDPVPLVAAAWFFLFLAPVLALQNHLQDYYLAVPSIGLALLGACAVSAAFRRGRACGAAATVLAGLYLLAGAVQARAGCNFMVEQSLQARTLVLGAQRARLLHPGKLIVLDGLDERRFWAGVAHRPFRLLGVGDVYVAPDSPVPAGADFARIRLQGGFLMSALAQGRAAVYRARPRALEAVTLAYFVDRKPHWKPGQPRAVDVGSPAFETQLGPTWYGIDNGMRWMPKHAAVRLGAPLGRAAALRVAGRCPAAQVRSGPLKVWFSLRGRRFAEASLPKGDAGFSVTLPLPAESALQDVIEIGIEVERTFRAPGDLRDLGLAFGTFEIREESGM